MDREDEVWLARKPAATQSEPKAEAMSRAFDQLERSGWPPGDWFSHVPPYDRQNIIEITAFLRAAFPH